MKTSKYLWSASLVLAAICSAPAASAAASGHLTIANCGPDGVVVTQTTIDWLPAGTGTGCIQTGDFTSVNYSGGTLGPSVTGTIRDLDVATTPLPVNSFMIFGALDFVLTELGPGPTNTTCAASFEPNNPMAACSAFAGSPFLLLPTPTGTSVTLSARGTVSDGTGTSNWLGAFTTQIAGVWPAEIQTRILAGESISSTFSGDFTIIQQRSCTLTQGGYKNNFNSLVLNFPVGGLTLGTRFYTNAELNLILQNNAVKGNGLISLAHQLITTELNLAYDAIPADPAQLQALNDAITAANALIGNLVIPPVGSGYLAPSSTSSIESLLDNYNNGGFGAPHCN